jgi:hypothetical protein
MRALTLLAAIVAVVGCGKSNEGGSAPAPGGGPGAGGTPPSTVTRNWKEFSSGNHEFKVRFPLGDPTEGMASLNAIPAFANATRFSTELWPKEGPPHTFAVVAGRFKKTVSKTNLKTAQATRDDAVDALRRGIVIRQGLKQTGEPKAVVWAGQPAKETLYEGEEKDGKKPRIIVRELVTESVAYFGVVNDPGGLTDAEVKQFFDSFQITSPAKPK